MSKKKMLVGAALVAAISGAVVSATPGSKVAFAPLSRATYEAFDVNFKSDEFIDNPQFKVKLWSSHDVDIATQIVTFQPGGYSGWHSHGGPVIIAVKTGTLTEYDGKFGRRAHRHLHHAGRPDSAPHRPPEPGELPLLSR